MSGYAFILTRGKAVPVIDKERLLAHVKVVTQVFDTDQGIARAREAAKDFDFPPEVFTRDQAVMDATGSLSAVREAVQYQGLEERFNADRVERCISSELVCPVRHAEGHCSPWGTDRFTGRLCDIWSAGGTSVDTATNTIGDAEACT